LATALYARVDMLVLFVVLSCRHQSLQKENSLGVHFIGVCWLLLQHCERTQILMPNAVLLSYCLVCTVGVAATDIQLAESKNIVPQWHQQWDPKGATYGLVASKHTQCSGTQRQLAVNSLDC
jgi:hypothetical protein